METSNENYGALVHQLCCDILLFLAFCLVVTVLVECIVALISVIIDEIRQQLCKKSRKTISV